MRYSDAYKDERQEEIRSLQTDVVEPLAAPTDKHAQKEKLPKSSLVRFQTQQCSFHKLIRQPPTVYFIAKKTPLTSDSIPHPLLSTKKTSL
jgi:hypothetical protein